VDDPLLEAKRRLGDYLADTFKRLGKQAAVDVFSVALNHADWALFHSSKIPDFGKFKELVEDCGLLTSLDDNYSHVVVVASTQDALDEYCAVHYPQGWGNPPMWQQEEMVPSGEYFGLGDEVKVLVEKHEWGKVDSLLLPHIERLHNSIETGEDIPQHFVEMQIRLRAKEVAYFLKEDWRPLATQLRPLIEYQASHNQSPLISMISNSFDSYNLDEELGEKLGKYVEIVRSRTSESGSELYNSDPDKKEIIEQSFREHSPMLYEKLFNKSE